MKKLLLGLLVWPLMALGNEIAIANNTMMGITVLTNDPCSHNKSLYAAYAYRQNKTYTYACWKIDANNIIFLDAYPALPSIPVKKFIKPPKTNDPR